MNRSKGDRTASDALAYNSSRITLAFVRRRESHWKAIVGHALRLPNFNYHYGTARIGSPVFGSTALKQAARSAKKRMGR
jgi:hypothetical protein